MMRTLVTGAAGFIGSTLVDQRSRQSRRRPPQLVHQLDRAVVRLDRPVGLFRLCSETKKAEAFFQKLAPSMMRDGDPPGVRATWSPGAMTGQRGGANSGWPRRRDLMSRVMLVVAVVLPGAGRVSTRLGAALCPSEPSVVPTVCCPLPSRVDACLAAL